jgi:hypothetical protein
LTHSDVDLDVNVGSSSDEGEGVGRVSVGGSVEEVNNLGHLDAEEERPLVELPGSDVEDEERSGGSEDSSSFDPVQGEASAVELVEEIIATAVSTLRDSQPELVEAGGSEGSVEEEEEEDSDPPPDLEPKGVAQGKAPPKPLPPKRRGSSSSEDHDQDQQ